MKRAGPDISRTIHRSGAFTLVELVVIITIIAVLISLTFVGLGATRRTSRTLQCQIQLRQVGAAIEAMRDRDGLLPSMRPPVGPLSKRTMMEMGLEFTERWYAALGAKLTPSSDTRLTSLGWSLWESPKPWRCPEDDTMNWIGGAWMESLGYDKQWTLAAQIGTSYDYIGTSTAFSPLIRAKADETSVRRALTRAAEIYPLAPLLFDAVPFHQRAPRQNKASDTNGYFQDGSVAALSHFPGGGQTPAFNDYVRSQFKE